MMVPRRRRAAQDSAMRGLVKVLVSLKLETPASHADSDSEALSPAAGVAERRCTARAGRLLLPLRLGPSR